MTDSSTSRQCDVVPDSRPAAVAPLRVDAHDATRDLTASYEADFAAIWRSLRRLGVPEADLEDRVHDVFVVAHRRIADLTPGAPVRPWLFGIALRVAANARRKRRESGALEQECERFDEGPGPEEIVAAKQAHALVMRALAVLEDAQREVIVLHDLEGMSGPEIAEATGAPLNTVYSRLRLARRRFVDALRALQSATNRQVPE